jgi:hypothetical protein
MRYLYTLIFLFITSFVIAQPITNNYTYSYDLLQIEQTNFVQMIDTVRIDDAIKWQLLAFATQKTDSLKISIDQHSKLNDDDKCRAFNSINYFLKSIRGKVVSKRFEVYDIPDALEKYPKILQCIILQDSIDTYVKDLGARRTQLMADAFKEYTNYAAYLNQIAVYKTLLRTPDEIEQFILQQPHFRYADSLLQYLASHQPTVIWRLLQHASTKALCNNSNHKLVRQLVSISNHYAREALLPFTEQLADSTYSIADILKARSDVNTYYSLLVNTAQYNVVRINRGEKVVGQQLIKNALHYYSNQFYINTVNELHNAKDKQRFECVSLLRKEDLYYIIINGEEELYTSSYIGLFNRLMKGLGNNAHELFTMVQFDDYRLFLKLAGQYGTLVHFLEKMPLEQRFVTLHKLVDSLEVDNTIGLEQSMHVADAFVGLIDSALYQSTIGNYLQENLNRCTKQDAIFGIRIYNALQLVWKNALRNPNDSSSNNILHQTLGINNYQLTVPQLVDSNNSIHHAVYFYGDTDGKFAYQGFIGLFDTTHWKKDTSYTSFVTFISKQQSPTLYIYANKPLDNATGADIEAQEKMNATLTGKSIYPTIITHRGHSYFLSNTLRYLNPNIQLAILGSCGGYKHMSTVANGSPKAQVIATKQTGSVLVNNPLMQVIHQNLLANKTIVWSTIFDSLRQQLQQNTYALSLLNEYIPPYKNLGLFVYRLFNEDTNVR